MRYRARAWRRTHRPGAALLAVAVALTGGLVLALVAGAVRTESAPDRYTAAHPGADFDVTIEQAAGAPRLEELRDLSAIDRVEMATFVFGGLVAEGQEVPIEALVFAGTPTAIGGEIATGRAPREPGEFAVTPAFIQLTQAQLGDQLTLLTISSEQAAELGFDVPEPDGPVLPATLVGVIEPLASELADATPLAVFPVELLDAGDIGIAASPAVADLAPGATVDDLRIQLDALDDGDAFSIESAAVVTEDVQVAVAAQAQALAVLAGIVALAAIVVLTQALSRQVRPTAAEDKALRAVGLLRRQVLLEPVGRAMAPVAIGSAGAAVLAILASGTFPSGFARRIEPDPGLRADPLVHLAGAVLFGAALLALVALLRATTRPPSDRESPRAVDRLATWSPSPQAGVGVRFAFGRDGRTGSVAAPLAGVVAVVGLVAAALTFGSNLDRLLDEPARYGERYDLTVGAGGGVLPDGLVEALEASPAVSGLAQYMVTTVQVESDSLGLVGMDIRKGDLAPEVLEGRLPQAPDELVLGSRAATDLDVGVGDIVTLQAAGGSYDLRLSGIAVLPGVEEAGDLGQIGAVTAAGMVRLDPDEQMSSALIGLAPGADRDEIMAIVESFGLSAGRFDVPAEIVNLRRVDETPYLVAAIVALLAVLSIGHLVVTAARRHRFDFAVLRAFGATRRWLRGVVHWQATAMAVVALVLAVPLGVAMGGVLFGPYAQRIGARPDAAVPIGWLAALAAGLLLVTNLAVARVARTVSRRPPGRLLDRDPGDAQ
jgi:hypothetical protein